jgi:O-antigen/teichoic acid export membrane protein
MTAKNPRSGNDDLPLQKPEAAPREDTSAHSHAGDVQLSNHRTLARAAGLIRRGAASALVWGTFIVFSVQSLATLARYLTQVMFARTAGPAEYGNYVFAYSWVQLFVVPAALGFATAVLRFVPKYLHTRETSKLLGFVRRSTQFALAGACGAAAIGSGVALTIVPFGPTLEALLIGFWMLPVLVLVNLRKAIVLSAQKLFFAYGTGELLPAVITVLTVGALLALTTVTATSMLLATLAGFLVALAVQQLGMSWALRVGVARRPPHQYETWNWLRIALPLGFSTIITSFTVRSDILFLGALRTASETGVYGAVSRTAALVSFILAAVVGFVAPIIGKCHATGQMRELEQVLRRVIAGTTAVSLVVFICILAFAVPILEIFGPAYAEGADQLRILAAGYFVNASTGPVTYVLALGGYHKTVVVNAVVVAALSVPGYLVLIPLLGGTGAAIVMATAIAVANLSLYITVRRKFGFRLFGLV